MSKIFFASDFHLGMDARLTSKERELQLVRWLEMVEHEASEIFLVGDLFDFWFEYKTVVPRGYVRFLGKLADVQSKGVNISVFTGNHDMWMFSYFEEELQIPVYRKPVIREFSGRKFLIGHGDGLGPGDHGYKFIKQVFSSRLCQWLFARLHPNFAFALANYWSGRSRAGASLKDELKGRDHEWLIQYAHEYLDNESIDYFVFGHRHLPIECTLDNGKSRYINLGDWLEYNSYAVFDGKDLKLAFFENDNAQIIHM